MRLYEIDDIEKIDKLLNKYFIVKGDRSIENGIVNIDGSLIIRGQKTAKLPITFGSVSGDCEFHNLTSLKGSPWYVGGKFRCAGSKYIRQLTSLEGCPKYVGGGFWCNNNKLTTLEGGPKQVIGDYICIENELTSLLGAPERVGSFSCSYNLLKSFVGGPKKIISNFFGYNNPTESLNGLPTEIGYSLQVQYSPTLPLLGILSIQHLKSVRLRSGGQSGGQIEDIINKYLGSGRQGALRCAAELSKAGFKGNARI